MEKKYQQFHLKPGNSIKQQQGAVAVILAAGMAALLAVAGLALDGGNLFLNKSKLQNAIDASALSAGAALNKAGGNYQKAQSSAIKRFQTIIATPGNEALFAAYDSEEISLTVTTSPTLSPFVGSNADDDWYVRVAVSAIQLDSFFLRVIGIDTLDVPATAVAGRTPVGLSDAGSGETSNPLCGIAPMMVCGDPAADPYPDDDSLPADTFWGYSLNDPVILKSTAKCQEIIIDEATGEETCEQPATAEDWTVGTGNFQLIQLRDEDGNTLSGGAEIRDTMAGSEDSCLNAVEDEPIPTETGNVVGPVVQGLNTRFGIYDGPMTGSSEEYPSDFVTDAPMSYDDYQTDYAGDYMTGCLDGCEEYRRIVAVPIGDCSESINGQGEIPLLGLGCFFVTQPAFQQGNDSAVYGQFVEDCPVSTTPPDGDWPTDTTSNPGSGNNKNKAYIIQLYKNPSSRDS